MTDHLKIPRWLNQAIDFTLYMALLTIILIGWSLS